jgi:hypothetical protein
MQPSFKRVDLSVFTAIVAQQDVQIGDIKKKLDLLQGMKVLLECTYIVFFV